MHLNIRKVQQCIQLSIALGLILMVSVFHLGFYRVGRIDLKHY
jgi:hypothetical protein